MSGWEGGNAAPVGREEDAEDETVVLNLRPSTTNVGGGTAGGFVVAVAALFDFASFFFASFFLRLISFSTSSLSISTVGHFAFIRSSICCMKPCAT